ncbi:unnamed protein product [Ceutorhynchus assimilis]|uniref:Uncharacterized protein n=1 Tax=Ceutorhynchus assimilis TaxID=467358 RepID=A0A9N9QNG8_9CUCU|nr:unnamed protein product [Ceutorhynchus assimilis]
MDVESTSRASRSNKRKTFKMDWEIAENDEWNQYFQNALQVDSRLDYKENSTCYNYSENGIEFEVTEQERQRYISFLSKIPELYTKLQCWPNNDQKLTALSIAAYVSQNEKIFVQLNSSGTYKALVQMAETAKSTTSSTVKVRYMDMLCSVFEHDAGLRWSLENKYWMEIYDLVVQCQRNGCELAEKMYTLLTKFLQNTTRKAPKVCVYVIKQMTHTLISIAHKNYTKTKKQPSDLLLPNEYKTLSATLPCLVEILERLLASQTAETLKYFTKLQVREACDTLAILSGDGDFSLQLNRIMVILSFFEMTELFDGIKVVKHDPIALSGFLRIVDRELKKEHLEAIFELYYYAQKYWKNVSSKMPQYFLKGKPVDIEDELMSFQVEPLVIIGEKILGVPQTSEEELRKCYLSDLLNIYSADCLQLGYEIRKLLNKVPLKCEITALKCLIKSKPLYSRQNLALVFQSLTYSLRDFIKYVKRNPELGQLEGDQSLAEALLDAILVYLENFDLSWRETIGSIELTNLVHNFLYYSTRWTPEVVLKALKALNITITKNMTPSMALLVDNVPNSTILDLGSMLFNKCFSNDPKVRDAALTVTCTICQKVNKGFTSFKVILLESLNQHLILNMALTDYDPWVRATALKCLQEMIVMEELGGTLLNSDFIDKILQLVSKEQEPMVLREALTLIRQIYQCEFNSETDNFKIYQVITKVALREKNPDVQEQAVKFWDNVIRKCLEKQGMFDDVFPSVIFSKELKKIIRLDDKEIRKRLCQTLDYMSKRGCFSIFQQILENENTPKQVFSTTVGIITKLLRLLQQYEVTPEFILFNQTYPNLWSVQSNTIQSPSNIEDDHSMQELVEETVMEMINGRLSFNQMTLMGSGAFTPERDSERSFGQVSTVDFMDFIYRKLPYLTNIEV